MTKLLFIFLIGNSNFIQKDTCEYRLIDSISNSQNFTYYGLVSDSFESKDLRRWKFNMVKYGHDNFAKEYYGLLLNYISLDSTIVVHHFEEFKNDSFGITKSLILNYTKRKIYLMIYFDKKVKVCELSWHLDHQDLLANDIYSINQNIYNPHSAIIFDRKVATYVVELLINGEGRSFYVNELGLPRKYFIEDSFNLMEGSIWKIIQGIFEYK